MSKPSRDQAGKYSASEAQSRIEAAVRAALSTPPQPRKSMTPKRAKAQRKKTKAAKRGS